MTISIETVQNKLYADVEAFRRELTPESDRGCALFAAAYLERALSDLLYVFLVAGKKIDSDLFNGTAPLSTFSSRIRIAFYLGLISHSVRRDLDLIRAIRNEFAHHHEPMSFSTESVANRCGELTHTYHEKGAEPRDQFTSTVLGILAKIHAATLTRKPLEEAVDKPPSEELKKTIQQKVSAASRQKNSRNDGT